ncbi:MAG: Cna B-type domain-containing protein, partial [Holdemanella sp.]|nr:Cna B-type domain-containing protein [Holdemanella sp.]
VNEYDKIEAAMKEDIKSGTNISAGLLAGEKMLDDDTSVDNSRKHLILVSDGITYIWSEDDDYKVTYGFSHEDSKGQFYTATTGAWMHKYGNTAYVPAEGYDTYLTNLFNDKSGIEAVKNKYKIVYDPANPDKSQPYMTYQDLIGETYCTMDVAFYETYYDYKRIESKYHTYAVFEQSSSGFKNGPALMEYMSGGKIVDFDDIGKTLINVVRSGSKIVDVMGNDVDNYGNSYDFDFIADASRLSLTEGNTKYDVTEITKGQEYGFGTPDNSSVYPYVLKYYQNGTSEVADEHFVLEINKDLGVNVPLVLNYSVKLTDPQTVAGDYGIYDQDGSKGYQGLYTNNSATLYPLDDTGVFGTPEEFPKPTVSYSVAAKYGVEYEFKSKSFDESGKEIPLPEEVKKLLPSNEIEKYLDGELVTAANPADPGTSKLTTSVKVKEGTWNFYGYVDDTKSWTVIKDKKIDAGPTGNINSRGNILFVGYWQLDANIDIPVAKEWDDANNKNGARPDSITVHLYADGKDTGKSLTLNKGNNWKSTFEDIPSSEKGKKIDYTVKEDAVKNYTSKVSVNEPGSYAKGFKVTNTYSKGANVDTGYNNNIFAWFLLLGLSSTCVVLIICLKRRLN